MSKLQTEQEVETWKQVPALNELEIEASNLGKIKVRWKQPDDQDYQDENILTPQRMNGSLVVALAFEYGLDWYPVARLTALSWFPIDIAKCTGTVKHLDGNILNCSVDNLQWTGCYSSLDMFGKDLVRLVPRDIWIDVIDSYLNKGMTYSDIAQKYVLTTKQVREFLLKAVWRVIKF